MRWLLALVLTAGVQAAVATGALSRIPLGSVVIDGEAYPAHIADDPGERGQGFQHVPAAKLRQSMIYFRFQRPVVPSFHMRNVRAPLAIAWIDSRHQVIGVSFMEPGGSGYRPPAPVVAALEVHPERLEALGIADGVSIRLDDPE